MNEVEVSCLFMLTFILRGAKKCFLFQNVFRQRYATFSSEKRSLTCSSSSSDPTITCDEAMLSYWKSTPSTSSLSPPCYLLSSCQWWPSIKFSCRETPHTLSWRRRTALVSHLLWPTALSTHSFSFHCSRFQRNGRLIENRKRSLLRDSPHFVFLEGPPGTGKEEVLNPFFSRPLTK